ncbi:MAG TPA: hypothetical protein VF846_19755 [Thermoanaerobaculia bacterium]
MALNRGHFGDASRLDGLPHSSLVCYQLHTSLLERRLRSKPIGLDCSKNAVALRFRVNHRAKAFRERVVLRAPGIPFRRRA